MRRVFLLSPANSGGPRAKMLLNERAKFDLATKLRSEGARIGEIYSFISGLYFRGKIAYAEAFNQAPRGIPGTLVITPGRGLLSSNTPVSMEELREIGRVPVDSNNTAYRKPLERDAQLLELNTGSACEYVLLGSIATEKYIAPLLEVFGDRLLFPSEFVGRGDMSRGGLMLRCAREGNELDYVPVKSAVRHGRRPPKLPPIRQR